MALASASAAGGYGLLPDLTSGEDEATEVGAAGRLAVDRLEPVSVRL